MWGMDQFYPKCGSQCSVSNRQSQQIIIFQMSKSMSKVVSSLDLTHKMYIGHLIIFSLFRVSRPFILEVRIITNERMLRHFRYFCLLSQMKEGPDISVISVRPFRSN